MHARHRLAASLLAAATIVAAPMSAVASDVAVSPAAGSAAHPRAAGKPALDRSGRKRVGVASVYSHRFAGRKMADGTRMSPHDDNAASRTLPIGTQARVTNVETGQSATVTIQDRGPYAKGRIVDLSPATAEQIGITREQGVAKVEVRPIALPPPDADKRR